MMVHPYKGLGCSLCLNDMPCVKVIPLPLAGVHTARSDALFRGMEVHLSAVRDLQHLLEGEITPGPNVHL